MRMQVGPYCTVSVESGPVDGVGVIRLGGEIDSAVTGELWPVVAAETARVTRAVVVELAEVTFFGSAGLSLLVDTWQAARSLGVGFAVATAQPTVLKPLHITQIDELMPVRPDVDQALAAALPAGCPPTTGS